MDYSGIDFHADDYGLFKTQSRRILKCRRDGVLTGISIIANGCELDSCLRMLPEEKPELTVHLNLMSGHCVAPADKVDLLVDENGVFNVRFRDLLLSPFTGRMRKYREQIREEYRAQIKVLLPLFRESGQPLRVDGHAHWHVLPVAFDALMDLQREDGEIDIRYIRLPYEPFGLYLRNFTRVFPFPPINIVKSVLLRILIRRDLLCWSREMKSVEKKVFLGVMFSGCFDIRRMRALIPGALELAGRKGQKLEILAHPGAVYEKEDLARVTCRDDRIFLSSRNRRTEAKSFLKMDL